MNWVLVGCGCRIYNHPSVLRWELENVRGRRVGWEKVGCAGSWGDWGGLTGPTLRGTHAASLLWASPRGSNRQIMSLFFFFKQ